MCTTTSVRVRCAIFRSGASAVASTPLRRSSVRSRSSSSSNSITRDFNDCDCFRTTSRRRDSSIVSPASCKSRSSFSAVTRTAATRSATCTFAVATTSCVATGVTAVGTTVGTAVGTAADTASARAATGARSVCESAVIAEECCVVQAPSSSSRIAARDARRSVPANS